MGKLEDLDKRVEVLLAESKDAFFIEYLKDLQNKIITQKYQADLLEIDFERAYKIYLQRNQQTTQMVHAPEQMDVAEQMDMPEQMDVPEQMDMPEQIESSRQIEGLASAEGTMVSQASVYHTAPAKKYNSAEFAVGAILLSVIGGVFILSALVMLGMNYMNGMVKGMALYAICLVVFAVAQCVLYPRWSSLGSTISAISVGGLYVTTLVNYLALRNFGLWGVVIISLLITLFIIWLSRKRSAIVHRILAMFSCAICCLMIRGDLNGVEFLGIAIVLLLVNLLCLFIPIKKYRTGLNITYMAAYSVFSFVFVAKAVTELVPEWSILVFWLTSVLVLHLCFVVEMRGNNGTATENKRAGMSVGMLVAYGISAVCVLGSVALLAWADTALWLGHAIVAGGVAIALFAFALLYNTRAKWAMYYFINLLVLVTYGICYGKETAVYCLLGMLIVAKLLSLCRTPALYVSEALLTGAACVVGLAHYQELCGVLLMGAILFSILFIRVWTTYYELVITFTLGFFAALYMPTMLKLSLFVGILFVGLLLFNNVKRWQGTTILVYNSFILIGEVICLLLLLNPIYRNAYLPFLFILVFGLATIILTFNEKYHMNFRWKNMALAVFLTYMALIFKSNQPILNSVFLMIIALVCVGIGFGAHEKKMRIYGLVLSLLVCAKLALYDFFGAATIQKTIVFLVVGIIALAIAAVYMILEKRNNG